LAIKWPQKWLLLVIKQMASVLRNKRNKCLNPGKLRREWQNLEVLTVDLAKAVRLCQPRRNKLNKTWPPVRVVEVRYSSMKQ
jgi:hypothetical protein